MDDKETLDRVAMSMLGLGNVMLNQSFLSNAGDVAKALSDDDRTSTKAAVSMAARTLNPSTVLVPFYNGIRQIERDMDPVQRDRVSVKASLLSYVPAASMFNKPALDILGDEIINRPADWLARAERDGTPEARIYHAMAKQDITPTSTWTYKGRMPAEMFYDFTRERGATLKAMLLADNGAMLQRLETAKPEVAERILENVSRAATQRAKATVGFFEYEQSQREE